MRTARHDKNREPGHVPFKSGGEWSASPSLLPLFAPWPGMAGRMSRRDMSVVRGKQYKDTRSCHSPAARDADDHQFRKAGSPFAVIACAKSHCHISKFSPSHRTRNSLPHLQSAFPRSVSLLVGRNGQPQNRQQTRGSRLQMAGRACRAGIAPKGAVCDTCPANELSFPAGVHCAGLFLR